HSPLHSFPTRRSSDLSSAFRVPVPSAQSGSPLQPAKTEPGAGVAVKLTTAPNGNRAEQLAPQSSPAGSLVTVPLPVPAFVSPRRSEEHTSELQSLAYH